MTPCSECECRRDWNSVLRVRTPWPFFDAHVSEGPAARSVERNPRTSSSTAARNNVRHSLWSSKRPATETGCASLSQRAGRIERQLARMSLLDHQPASRQRKTWSVLSLRADLDGPRACSRSVPVSRLAPRLATRAEKAHCDAPGSLDAVITIPSGFAKLRRKRICATCVCGRACKSSPGL